jgi:membrane carboxypeptidase/penicillin-binding protein PbpC
LPSFGEQSALYIGQPAAAKTGTTTDWRDNWTVGYTPDLVTGVWVGNADNAPMYHVSGITGAGPIWHDFMVLALKGRPPVDFDRPDGLVEVEVCALSGKLPNRNCAHRRHDLFIAGTEPVVECDIHQVVRIDTATGLQATDATPPERVRERIYAVYPPEALAWAVGQGIPQPPPAPEAQTVETGARTAPGPSAPIEIVSPFQMDRYRLSNALPLEDQKIMIEARPGGQIGFAVVTLYVNGEPLQTFRQAPYRLWWQLLPGTHEIYAVGETANGQEYVSESITLVVDG